MRYISFTYDTDWAFKMKPTDKELLDTVDESKLGKGADVSNKASKPRKGTKNLKPNGKYSQKTSKGK